MRLTQKISSGFAFTVIIILVAVLGSVIWIVGHDSFDNQGVAPATPGPTPSARLAMSRRARAEVESKSINVFLQRADGTIAGSVSIDMPEGWSKKSQQLILATATAPKIVEKTYSGAEGELSITNHYDGMTCAEGFDVKSSSGIVFNVCPSFPKEAFVHVSSPDIVTTATRGWSGTITFSSGLKSAADQRAFIEKLLATAVFKK